MKEVVSWKKERGDFLNFYFYKGVLENNSSSQWWDCSNWYNTLDLITDWWKKKKKKGTTHNFFHVSLAPSFKQKGFGFVFSLILQSIK